MLEADSLSSAPEASSGATSWFSMSASGAASGLFPSSPSALPLSSIPFSGVLKLEESQEKNLHFSSCLLVRSMMFQLRFTGWLGCKAMTCFGHSFGHSWNAKKAIVMLETSDHFMRTLPTLHTRSSTTAAPSGTPFAPPLRRSSRSALDMILLLKISCTSADVISSSPASPIGRVPVIASTEDLSFSMIQFANSCPHADISMLLKAFKPDRLSKLLASAANSMLQLVGIESSVLSSGGSPGWLLLAPFSLPLSEFPASSAPRLTSWSPSKASTSLTTSSSRVHPSAIFLILSSRELALSRSTPS
mmetsp:Transcript_9075/g.25821  ORF Transcript_9075/g.25821 Transcript_9075/m.25821 type:complete len:304 (-) Transcript_9075:850-1761(-)